MHNPDKNNLTDVFPSEPSLSSSVTFACNIYSMVPYIGIVFVPFATIFGGRDYLTARRDADHEGARSAVRFLALSFVIVVFQVFLWGLLYIVPTLAI